MGGHGQESLLAGALAGVTTVGFAALAHSSSGGSLNANAVVIAAAVAIAIGGALATLVRVTFWRVAALCLAAQPLLHVAFGHGGGPADAMVHAGRHDRSMKATGTDTDIKMLVAHMALALAVAVVVRWGLRWLRSMPDLARALVVVERRVVAPVPMPAGLVPALDRVAAPPRPVLRSWDNRGPPV